MANYITTRFLSISARALGFCILTVTSIVIALEIAFAATGYVDPAIELEANYPSDYPGLSDMGRVLILSIQYAIWWVAVAAYDLWRRNRRSGQQPRDSDRQDRAGSQGANQGDESSGRLEAETGR